MKILFSSLPAHGHTYPLLPLAIAAKEAGHEITYATWDTFHPPLAALGFETIKAGGDMSGEFGRALDGRQIADLTPDEVIAVAHRVFGDVLSRIAVADLEPLLRARDFDLVVYEAAAFGAAIAAKRVGVPAISHGISKPTSLSQMPALQNFLPTLAAEYGVEFSTTNRTGFGDPYLDIYPESLQDSETLADYSTRVPLRPVSFATPGDLPPSVTTGQGKLIYLTLGTAFGNLDVLRTAITGLAATGHRVLVAAGPTVDIAALGEPPANVTIESWVPQAEVLPHTDLVVHHGGSGTTLGTAAVGVRQLFLPQGADQFINAETFTTAGAATQLLGEAVTPDAVTEAATNLLANDAAAKIVAALAEEIAALPSPTTTVTRFPEWATRP
ncbi:glycosyltransferase [Actinokineospora globicatena]|uniref:Glycosyl transferase n=1 Tax=Actinokineospora globicatena TaxID=103729 RepID=A0A9W6QQS7_9PSEU|nr:glycosyltransferase [Actinokineospora globicatena]GLW93957.1 glycosyl transferase [Actinokineospora globicatena]